MVSSTSNEKNINRSMIDTSIVSQAQQNDCVLQGRIYLIRAQGATLLTYEYNSQHG